MALTHTGFDFHPLKADPTRSSFEDRTLESPNYTNQTRVSHGLPELLLTKQAWLPSEFTDEKSYVVLLHDSDKLELDAALSCFKGS